MPVASVLGRWRSMTIIAVGIIRFHSCRCASLRFTSSIIALSRICGTLLLLLLLLLARTSCRFSCGRKYAIRLIRNATFLLWRIKQLAWRILVSDRTSDQDLSGNRARWLFIRPSDILVGGLRFYRDSSSFFFFFQLPSELAGRNSTEIGHMLGNECDLKMYHHHHHRRRHQQQQQLTFLEWPK